LLTNLLANIIVYCSPGCEWYLTISFEGTTLKNMIQQLQVRDHELLASEHMKTTI